MTSISGRVLKGSLWVTVTRLLTNGLSIFSTFILAWYLTPADFGVVAIGTTILTILSSLTEFSLSQALVRHEAPDESHLSAAWTLNVSRGIVLATLVCGAAWPIAYMFEDHRLREIMLALGLSLFISGFANPKMAMAQRSLEYWQFFTVSTGQKLIGFIAAVAIAVIYQSYWALIIGSLATQLANVTLSYIVMPFRPRILFRYFREFFGFSGWLMGSQIVNTLNWRFDELLVGKFIGTTALGLYTMGGNLAQIPTRETTAPLTQPLFPSFNLVKDDPERLRAVYQRVQSLVTAIALPAGIGTAAIAYPVVELALGPKWIPAAGIVETLAVIFALQTLGSLASPLAMALGRTKTLFIRDSQLLLVRVPIMIVGALAGGLSGVVTARVVSGTISIILNLIMVKNFIGIGLVRQILENIRTIISATAMGIMVIYLQSLLPESKIPIQQGIHIACLIAFGAAIYSLTLYTLWTLTGRPKGAENELKLLLSKIIIKISQKIVKR